MWRFSIYLLILLLACGPNSPTGEVNYKLKSLQGEAQGTTYLITWAEKTPRSFKGGIDSIFTAVDQQFSTYIPSSAVSRFNASDSGITVDSSFQALLMLSKGLWEQTKGAFDPTVMPLVRAYGFGPENKPDSNLSAEHRRELLGLVGFQRLELRGNQLFKAKPGMQLDFNAIAQGYTVDLIADYLDRNGITSYMVEVGGELRLKKVKPDGQCWKVGIDKPIENNIERELKEILSITDIAIATSGNYRKYVDHNGVRYTHTVDPISGEMKQHSLLSATLFAPSSAVADALATAFMVVGFEKSKELLSRQKDVEALLIFRNKEGKMESFFTAGFRNHLLCDKKKLN